MRLRNTIRNLIQQEAVQHWDQPAFRKWFAGSKVTGRNGQPLRVYHGSFAGFDQFKTPKYGKNELSSLGPWFSADPNTSNNFTADPETEYYYTDDQGQEHIVGRRDAQGNGPYIGGPEGSQVYFRDTHSGAQTYPVYLRLENPLILTSTPKRDALEQLMDLRDEIAQPEYYFGKRWDTYAATRSDRGEDSRKFRDELIRRGYDGIILKGTVYDNDKTPTDQFVVFNPQSQIKSAVGNSGAYQGSGLTEATEEIGQVQVKVDPSPNQILAWAQKTYLRGTYYQGHVYIWDAHDGYHAQIRKALGDNTSEYQNDNDFVIVNKALENRLGDIDRDWLRWGAKYRIGPDMVIAPNPGAMKSELLKSLIRMGSRSLRNEPQMALQELHQIEIKDTVFYENPNGSQLYGLLKKARDHEGLRGLVLRNADTIFVWDAWTSTHQTAYRELLAQGVIENDLMEVTSNIKISLIAGLDQIEIVALDSKMRPMDDFSTIRTGAFDRLLKSVERTNKLLWDNPKLAKRLLGESSR